MKRCRWTLCRCHAHAAGGSQEGTRQETWHWRRTNPNSSKKKEGKLLEKGRVKEPLEPWADGDNDRNREKEKDTKTTKKKEKKRRYGFAYSRDRKKTNHTKKTSRKRKVLRTGVNASVAPDCLDLRGSETPRKQKQVEERRREEFGLTMLSFFLYVWRRY